MDKVALLENQYYAWLKNDLVFSKLDDDYVSISTPFIDSNYDNINLYARFVGNSRDRIEVSDFGYTIYNLENAGINLKRSKTSRKIFDQILVDFGVDGSDDNLSITTSLDRFPIAKTRLLQAIMRINDLVYLNKENVKTAFNDLVAKFFDDNNVLYTPSIEISTPDGLASHFDFSIPNRRFGERLVKTASRPNDINAAKVFNFDVKVTQDTRPAMFIFLADDANHQSEINDSLVKTATNGLPAFTAQVMGFAEIGNQLELLSNAS